MRKVVSFSLFGLLLYHTLAHVLVCMGTWWQAEHDLTERLMVYRSVDSLVEFQIPLHGDDATALTSTTNDGFTYRGRYYEVVSLALRSDTLHIAGLEMQSHPFWQSDLLAFLDKHLSGSTDAQQKANQLLKFLLKEYSPTPHISFSFLPPYRHQSVRLPNEPFAIPARALPVHSPPPQA